MKLTHHPVRLFRLSCGCLRAYPMMPAGIAHTVLCVTCRQAAVTTVAYPEAACAVTGWAQKAGQQVRASCTLFPGECTGMFHVDAIAGVSFTPEGIRLARSREGKTGRA